MNKRWFQLILMAAMLLTGFRPALAADVVSSVTNGIPLCVMTFNLRYASLQKPNAWPDRRPVMRDCIQTVKPDLIGTQEGLYWQLKDLAADLPAYDWIGLGREGGSHGEFMAVFYRRDRFEPVEYDHFWLSDTPAVIGSATWGNINRRMVTWVRFRDRQSGREFYFWNTHFDQAVELARQKSASLICQRMTAMDPHLPLVLTGDFNCPAGRSRAWEILTQDGGLADTWPLAREHANARLNSFHGYQRPQAEGERIDWIFVRGPVTVAKAEVDNFSEHGQFPSDHFPVVAWLTLGANSQTESSLEK
jgi:endonuclease/exonuclease/phosphatase family metal-dependent hydrolase